MKHIMTVFRRAIVLSLSLPNILLVVANADASHASRRARSVPCGKGAGGE